RAWSGVACWRSAGGKWCGRGASGASPFGRDRARPGSVETRFGLHVGDALPALLERQDEGSERSEAARLALDGRRGSGGVGEPRRLRLGGKVTGLVSGQWAAERASQKRGNRAPIFREFVEPRVGAALD